LAVTTLNNNGGLVIGGRTHLLVLHVEDTKNTPGEAVDAARRLIDQQGIAALIGPNISRNAIPVAAIAENARIPMITPGSTNPQTTADKTYVFRVAFTDPFQGKVMARFARQDLDLASVAVLFDVANAYNRDIAASFKQAYEGLGGEVVAFESYITGDQDFRPQLARIRESRPEALFLPNYNADVALQVQQARQMGIDALILGSDGWTPTHLTHISELEGAFLSHHWHLGVAETNDRARSFIDIYRRTYHQDPDIMAAQTYDAFGLLYDVLRRTGRTDPESIRQGLSQTAQYQGVTGTMTYHNTGGDPQKHALIMHIRNGQTVLFKVVAPQPEPPQETSSNALSTVTE
ncbi:MAG: ABC transporter substrate-binding protein, partial [Rhodothermales bacterium]